MNLDTAVSKLETIASRILDPIHISGFETIFEGKPLYLLYPVKEIWVFGSAVYVDDPRDLDIIIVGGANSKILHSQFCDEREKAPNDYWRFYSYQQLTKKTLLKKMKNVDIHFDELETLRTPLKILVWSHEKLNIKENFLTGRQNVDPGALKGECRHLRKLLKKNENDAMIHGKIASIFMGGRLGLTEPEKLVLMNRFFTKKYLPQLRQYYEDNEKLIGNFFDLRLLKKFIEIKEKKGSDNVFFNLRLRMRFCWCIKYMGVRDMNRDLHLLRARAR